MSIAPIPSVPGLPVLPSIGGPQSLSAAGGLAGASSAAGAPGGPDAFSNVIGNAVDALQQAQSTASSYEAAAAAGQGNLADTMIAASQASLDTEVTSDLLTKAVGSYNSIMGMAF